MAENLKNCKIYTVSDNQVATLYRNITNGIPNCIKEAFESVVDKKSIERLTNIKIEVEGKGGVKKFSEITKENKGT